MKFLFFVLAASLFSNVTFAEDRIHVIAVNGSAERAVDPNMTVLQIEVWGKGANAKAAQEIQTKFFAKVKDAVDKYKIKKEDFQTQNYSINPEYFYDQKTQQNKIVGYRVSHVVSLIYRKVDNAGSLVDSLADSAKGDNGGVSVQSISWDYDKKSVVESSALAEAVKQARAKAEELAKAAGVSIKAVHRITHQAAAPVVMGRFSARAMDKDAAIMEAPTELSSGQVKVHIDVQMEFEI